MPAADHGGAPAPPPSTQQQPATQPAAARSAHHDIPRTRAGGVWVALALSAIVLLLLLVFILENQQNVSVAYFGAHAQLPLGVALLLAAVGGALLAVIAGTARIMQLRAHARRRRNAQAQAQGSSPQPSQPGQA
jgi:uncharacterized integral membrane protein